MQYEDPYQRYEGIPWCAVDVDMVVRTEFLKGTNNGNAKVLDLVGLWLIHLNLISLD